MSNKLDTIEIVTDYKHIQIREITDSGGYHRRVLTSDMDVSSEVQEIQDKAEEVWTDGVKSAWAKLQAEQQAKDEELRAEQEAEQEAEQNK